MAGDPQSPDMDAKQIAERHVIERYLADQLSDAEADAFEAYVEAHPEVARQIELVARMKSGLGVLHRRGELQSALNTSPRSWIRHPALLTGVAASIAVASLLVFRFTREPIAPSLATSFEHLRGSGSDFLQLGKSVSLLRARGMTPGATVVLPADGAASIALELVLVTGEVTRRPQYAVEILKLDSGELQSIARLSNVAARADGSLHLFVRGSVLGVGHYVIRLTTAEEAAPIEFTMLVTSAEAG